MIKDGVERQLIREINALSDLLDKAYELRAELLRLKVEAETEAVELAKWSDDTDGMAEGYEAIVKAMRKRLQQVQEEERDAQFQRNMENEQALLDAENRDGWCGTSAWSSACTASEVAEADNNKFQWFAPGLGEVLGPV